MDFVNLPQMTDPEKLAAMLILIKIVPAAYYAYPDIYPLMVCKRVNLSFEYGHAGALSTHAYVGYGGILCGRVGDIDSGYQFGQLALRVLSRLQDKEPGVKTAFVFELVIRHWKEHVRNTLEASLEKYQRALESGDLYYVASLAFMYCSNAYLVGQELIGLAQDMAQYSAMMDQLKQQHTLYWNEIYRQTVLNLIGQGQGQGQAEIPTSLIGDAYDERPMLPIHLYLKDSITICYLYVNKLTLCYLFQDYAQALENAKLAEQYVASVPGTLVVAIFHFYDSLVRVAMYAEATPSEQEAILEKVAANQEKMKQWANHAPMNFQHKYALVEAEKARVLRQALEAIDGYEEAIKGAKKNQYIQEEALAYELAANFYLARGMDKVAQTYLREAHYAYQQWGAIAKVTQMEASYPSLRAIHQKLPLNANRLTQHVAQRHPRHPPAMDTSQLITQMMPSYINALDLNSVIKASQAISGEIVLSQLLSKIMRLVIENAGAQRGLLILAKEKGWVIEAEASADEQTMQTMQGGMQLLHSRPIEADKLATTVVWYVARTQKDVVLHHATQEGPFTQDDYVLQTQPLSILCLPLLNQGKVSGILYLENNLITGAFTPDRLEVLKLLSAQAAIALDNALLYADLQRYREHLEELVHERTKELTQTLDDQQANQLLSTFLANMSHELRTPLNAILGFSQLMGRSHTLPAEHQAHLGIISRSGEHLLTLINNVLDLSKIEAGRTTLNHSDFDLYRLLDDLENMFQLKAADKELPLFFECAADVPRYIHADEVKLRQILINLLNNALKFTPQGHVSLRVMKTKTDSTAQRAILTFEVQDSGVGIAADELDSVFEAFAQSESGRQAQEGTGLGLGLPISRQFVQLMGGEMRVTSQVGQGSTFSFDISVRLVADSLKSLASTRQVIGLAPNQPTYRILIVDDKQNNRQLLVELLAPLG